MTESNPHPGPGPGRSASRVWWVVGLLFVVFWCVYLSFFGPAGPGGGPPVLEGTALSKPADYGWVLSDLDGKPVSFEQYRGKTVFLNIWATWCRPCVAELPAIAGLARTPGLVPVKFVCVSIDRDRETVRQFLEGKDWPMTFLHASDVPPAFSAEGVPATFLIAHDGTIAASVLGGAEWNDPSVVRFLQRLLGAQLKAAPAP